MTAGLAMLACAIMGGGALAGMTPSQSKPVAFPYQQQGAVPAQGQPYPQPGAVPQQYGAQQPRQD